jgi:cytosine deaminase
VPDPFLDAAFDEAGIGLAEGGIPIGSVLVLDGEIVGRGHNRRVQKGSPILHGEMDALENAGRLVATEYRRSVIYTTLSPCPMCTGAILLYEIPKVVIGENRTFLGAEDLLRANGVEVVVLDDQRCVDMMTGFIQARPDLWNEDIGEV